MARGIVAAEPEVYVLGPPFLYAATSDVMTGVGSDAPDIARHIGSPRTKVALVRRPHPLG